MTRTNRDVLADLVFKEWAEIISTADDSVLTSMIEMCADLAASDDPIRVLATNISDRAAANRIINFLAVAAGTTVVATVQKRRSAPPA